LSLACKQSNINIISGQFNELYEGMTKDDLEDETHRLSDK
jgi:hypothetical protein